MNHTVFKVDSPSIIEDGPLIVEKTSDSPKEEVKGFKKVRGLVYQFCNITLQSFMYTSQKLLLQRSLEDGNPINPNEWTYWTTLILLTLNLLTMKYLKADLFPLPKEVRATYILRCVVGMMCNLTFLFSLQFIPFAKASVLFWTAPVFIALFAFVYLGEQLSKYDWAAVFVAFVGLLMIQNPFGQQASLLDTSFLRDLVGSGLAFAGAILGATVAITIRMIAKQAILHFMLVPMGFALGSVFLCPIFMTCKVLITPVDPGNTMVTQTIHHSHTNGTTSIHYEVGASLHVYSCWDICMIVWIALL